MNNGLKPLEEFVKRLFVFFHLILHYNINVFLNDMKGLQSKEDLDREDFSFNAFKYIETQNTQNMNIGLFREATKKVVDTMKETSKATFGDSAMVELYRNYNMVSIIDLLQEYAIPLPKIPTIIMACHRIWAVEFSETSKKIVNKNQFDEMKSKYNDVKINQLIGQIFNSYITTYPDSFTQLYVSVLNEKHSLVLQQIKTLQETKVDNIASALANLKIIVEE